MNAICVIDSSLPPYAAPLAHECVATVLVPPASSAEASWGQFVLGVAVALLAVGVARFVRLVVL